MNRRELLAEIGPVARDCLRRAAGQHGLLALPVKLETTDPVTSCNAGTLFEIAWRIDNAGRIRLTAHVDSIPFSNEAVL